MYMVLKTDFFICARKEEGQWQQRQSAHALFFFCNDLGIKYLVDCRVDGGGRMPMPPSNHATRSDGCAPLATQYRTRSELAVISLMLSFVGMGLYVPI
jgi:hypothetical protein